jgi:hypothetical protein
VPNTTVEALTRASKGLLYLSEKDEPFTAFSWDHTGELTPEALLRLGNHHPGEPVEEVDLETFFRDLTRQEDWHGEEEKATVAGYRKLLDAVRRHLEGSKVFRVGTKHVTIYLVGRTGPGHWAGLRTTALET